MSNRPAHCGRTLAGAAHLPGVHANRLAVNHHLRPIGPIVLPGFADLIAIVDSLPCPADLIAFNLPSAYQRDNFALTGLGLALAGTVGLHHDLAGVAEART